MSHTTIKKRHREQIQHERREARRLQRKVSKPVLPSTQAGRSGSVRAVARPQSSREGSTRLILVSGESDAVIR
jgi:hypothetical protein